MQNSHGIPIELGKMIKRGGEAKIFEVKEKPNLVAKVYHEHRTEQKAKLQAMLARVPTQPASHTALAWPLELLYEQGQLAGFLMPKIEGYERIFNFYNPMRRKKRHPSFNRRYLHRTASNLAIVIETVHQAGHVVGDLNESNVLVNHRTLVTLVDTDSFQIQDTNGDIYRCAVGKAEYTPPELHQISLSSVNQRPEHDYFGLAVLIFQLLMQGYHPFAGVLPADLSVERVDLYAIKKGIFPYHQPHNALSRIPTPPNAPPFALLHPDLQALFIRCFVDGHNNPAQRPTTREWRTFLHKAEQALVICEHDVAHIYSDHLAGCPFCPSELVVQNPLPATPGNATPSHDPTLHQSSSLPAPTPATGMQSWRQFLSNPFSYLQSLFWSAILIASVAVIWFGASSISMSPESEPVVESPVNVAVDHTPTVANTPSPKSQASKTVVNETATTNNATGGEGLRVDHIACFGTAGFGVTCLDDVSREQGGANWTYFSEDNSPLGGDWIYDMAACPDNRVLIGHSSGISSFDGHRWHEYLGDWSYASLDAIACDVNGGIWATHGQGVTFFTGSKEIKTPFTKLSARANASHWIEDVDVAVAPGGRVWVVTAHTVATTLDGTEWTIYQEGQGFDKQYSLESIAIDDLGKVWVTYDRGVLHFDGTDWVAHKPPIIVSPEAITVDHDRNIWLGTISDGVLQFDGEVWREYNTRNSGLISNDVQALAIDEQGRLWAGTDWGLSIFDGDEWITYQMNNADLVANDIRNLAVIGDGPVLPEAIDKENGQLRGQLLKFEEKPLANAAVEICAPDSDSFFDQSPCEDQPFVVQTTTDADGYFSITNIPAGRFILTVDIGEGVWIKVEKEDGLKNNKVLIKPREETDLGTLEMWSN